MTIGFLLMESAKHYIAAGEFKAKCLQLMDEVNQLHQELIITKHGKPVARLVPYVEEPPMLFGCLSGSLQVTGDIVAPPDESWSVNE
jgi:prevent-host-death family protein